MSTTISREIDVFETQGGGNIVLNSEDDRNSESVEKIDTGFHSSFSMFKKKQLKPNKADFSDNISRPPTQYGFKTEPNEYELTGTSNETVLQRYHRLKLEVSELLSEVDQLENSKADLSGASPADIISDLHQLQSTLNQLELDRILTESSTLIGSDNIPHSVLFKQLQAQVSAAKAPPTSTDESSSGGGPVYEVYANVEAAKFGHLSKVSELEKRLSVLEGLVGKSDTKVSVVAAGLDAEFKDLSSAVLGLQSKVALLDETHVQSVNGQLKELLTSLQKLGDNKSKDKDGNEEHKAKVSQALETVSTIAPLISVVPDVVNRLHALKDLHEQACQLVSTIASVSSEQDRIANQLTALKSLLDQVQSSVSSSVETLKGNFENLEARINKR